MDVSAHAQEAAQIAEAYGSAAAEAMWRNPVKASTLAAQENVANEMAVFALKAALESAGQVVDILV